MFMRWRSAGGLVSLALGIWLACLPTRARAAACCTSAAVFGVGRLTVWEDAAFGVRTGVSDGLGLWRSDGSWSRYPDGYADLEGRAEAWALVRASDRLQFFLRAPGVVNHRAAGALSEWGGGLGDGQVGGRYELVGVGEYLELPAIAVSGSVLLPTGRRAEDVTTPLGTDATGRGVWGAALALEVEHNLAPWFVRLDAGVRATLGFTRSDLGVVQRYGPGVTAALSGGRALEGDRVVLAVLVQFDHEGALQLGDRVIDSSSSRALTASLACSWRLHPHWTLQSSLSTGVLADQLGANRPGQVGFVIGVRHGVF